MLPSGSQIRLAGKFSCSSMIFPLKHLYNLYSSGIFQLAIFDYGRVYISKHGDGLKNQKHMGIAQNIMGYDEAKV